MSSIGNPSMYHRKVVKLSAALTVALLMILTFGKNVLFAQEASILVTKPDVTTVQGATVTVEITVQNTGGNGDLTNVTLTDTACPGGATRLLPDLAGNGDNTLAVGETWRYGCTINAGTSSFSNFAEARAFSVANNTPVSDSDAGTVTVLNRGIHVIKSAVTNPITQGSNADFTITVQNTGLAGINEANLTINDALCSPAINPANPNSGDNGNNILDADPDGNITDGDVNGEIWSYTCTVPNAITDKVTNSVVVTAKDTTNATWMHNASATIEVLNPGLAVTKSPSKSSAVVGESVVWTIAVFNTGETALGVPTVTDSQCAPVNYVSGDPNGNGPAGGNLQPGEQWIYNCTRSYGAPGVVNNIVTVTAGAQSDTATGTINIVQPGIMIEKTPFIAYVIKGGSTTFTVKVTNNGQGNLTNVVVEDLICSNAVNGKLTQFTGDDGDNILEPDNLATPQNEAETWSYSCTVNNVQANDTNVATVTAKDISNNTLAATATANVVMINPGINIAKSLVGGSILKGQTANFNLVVTNAGNAELRNLVVSDPQCDAAPVYNGGLSNDVDADGRLDPGDSFVYTCSKANVQADFTNIASVTALQANINQTVSDDDKLDVDVLTPGLQLEKTPPFQVIQEGQAYQWTLRVRNTGQAPLTAAPLGGGAVRGVSDPLCATLTYVGGDTNTNNVLETTEVWELTCTGPLILTFTQDEIINTAVASFTDGINTVTDVERATVQVVRNIIDVEKTASPAVIVAGGSVNFSFQVRNYSGQSLTSVAVTDTQCPGGVATYSSGDAAPVGQLNPGEVWNFVCTVSGKTADFTNIATVTAKQPNNNTVTDTDTASVQVLNAKLDVDKTTSTPVVQQGGSASFTIQVKNTGTLQLKEVTPVDDKCTLSAAAGDLNLNGLLDAGETWTYTCTVTNVQSDFVNSVTVTAKEVGSNLIVTGMDSVGVTVIRPSINIQKTANQTSVQQGGTAYFTIVINNGGSTNLTNVQPVDAFCPLVEVSKGNGNATLEVGETWVFSCAVANVQGTNGTFVNTASVSATDTNGIAVNASSSASVTVTDLPTPTPTSTGVPPTPTFTPTPTPTITPTPPAPLSGKLKLQKSPATQTVLKGATVTFQVTLNNGTTEDLTNISLSDPQCTSLVRLADAPGNNDATLNIGETWRWTCTIANVQKSFTNKAKVTAIRPNGKKRTASASAKVKVVKSSQIRIETSVTDVTVNPGASVPMRITVTNIGAGNLRDLQVSHSACTDAPTYVDGDRNGNNVLNRGESWVYTCTVVNVQGEINGVATAAALDDSNTVQEDDALSDIAVFTDEEDEEVAEPGFKFFLPGVSN